TAVPKYPTLSHRNAPGHSSPRDIWRAPTSKTPATATRSRSPRRLTAPDTLAAAGASSATFAGFPMVVAAEDTSPGTYRLRSGHDHAAMGTLEHRFSLERALRSSTVRPRPFVTQARRIIRREKTPPCPPHHRQQQQEPEQPTHHRIPHRTKEAIV